jgi:biotin-(acetyl-CoA carboxylase) ligase
VDFARYVLDLERSRPRSAAGGGRSGPENLVILASTVSTNAVARGLAGDYESEGLDLIPTLVLAFEQTGGRGRQGRSWSSPRGRGVYATLAQPYAQAELLPALPLLVGVGLCRALAPHLPHGGCRLKWPNDLLVPGGAPSATSPTAATSPTPASSAISASSPASPTSAASPASQTSPAPEGPGGGGLGRKIGGILIEARVQPEDGCVALIGFGVNHGQRRDELPAGATSLLLETGGAMPGLAALTWELVAGVEAELAHLGDLPYAAAAYRGLSIHRPGDPLLWRAGEREIAGTFAGFDDTGRLQLQPTGGGEMVTLSAGEVIEP